MKNFSVIIPTMWKSDFLSSALLEYVNSELINEIIIIDNNPTKKILLPESNKIKYLSKGHNIFVNPSWNWGVKESINENLLIINDDLLINNIDLVLNEINKHNYDLLGLNPNKIDKDIIIDDDKYKMPFGWGCFIFIKKSKYITIPEELKIWYGDRYLFDRIINKGLISIKNLKIEFSKTIKSDNKMLEITNFDRLNFKKIKKI
jgi:hypothetical protein